MNRFMKMQIGSLALALGLALGAGQIASAQTTQPADPPAVLSAFEKVAFGNAQDIDAALALMTDDAVLRVIPPPPGTTGVWTGKAEIRQGLQYNKANGVMRENIGTPQVEGNKLTTKSMVTNNFFTLWGVAPVEHSTEIIVEGGKIKSYTSTMSPSEQGRVVAAAKAYQQAHAAPGASPAQPAPAAQPAPVAQPAQVPVGMPRTGDSTPSMLLVEMLIAGLLVLGLGILTRRTPSKL